MAHPYMPNSTPEAKSAMLHAIGIADVNDLFAQIPADHRPARPIELPPAVVAEMTVHQYVGNLLARNATCAQHLNFLGAGCWQHHVPAACDQIAARGEFLATAGGTPSSNQGRYQAWFEFASMLGELVGMDFVGQPVHNWAVAAGHALRMALRLTGRHEVLVPSTLDPERLAVIRTYCGPAVSVVPVSQSAGRVDLGDLRAKASTGTAASYLETPNHLGVIEADAEEIFDITHRLRAVAVVGVDPISLGVLKPPSEYGADIAVGPTQPLGVHMNAGGGTGGFIATKAEERFVREFATPLVSMCGTATPGGRAFATAQGDRGDSAWAAVNATYLALLGPQGFADIGETILRNSAHAATRIGAIPGLRVRWPGFFKEFVVDFTDTGRSVAQVNEFLRTRGIFGGKDLSADFPALGQSALYCVTEIHTAYDISFLVDALTEAVTT